MLWCLSQILEKRVIMWRAQTAEIIDEGAGRPRGLFRQLRSEGRFRYIRRLPPPDLTPWINHFWMVRWDLRGVDPYEQETLPHPNVHVVFEEDNSCVYGVVTGKFVRKLVGKSQV